MVDRAAVQSLPFLHQPCGATHPMEASLGARLGCQELDQRLLCPGPTVVTITPISMWGLQTLWATLLPCVHQTRAWG